MIQERRQYQRLVPSAPLFISLDDSKSGLLLDLCEGGLAVASLVPRNLDEVVSLEFDLPEGTGHVQATAKIAWTRDSGHLTGVRFVDFDGVSQQQLCEWISAGTNLRLAPNREAAEPVFVTRSTYAQVDPIPQEMRDQGAADERLVLFSEPFAGEAEEQVEQTETVEVETPARERAGKSRYTLEWVLAIVVLSWALVYLGYHMGSTGTSRQSREMAATPKVTEASTKPELASLGAVSATSAASRSVSTATSALKSAPATKPAGAAPTAGGGKIATADSSIESGIVVQVGAMKVEDNASALAKDLREKKFPAFVFRHGGDKFYRVAVGPYSNTDSGAKVKDELEKQGFKPLLQHWARD
jgi:cell division septation protein DedD